jgi:hypothetical protein
VYAVVLYYEPIHVPRLVTSHLLHVLEKLCPRAFPLLRQKKLIGECVKSLGVVSA